MVETLKQRIYGVYLSVFGLLGLLGTSVLHAEKIKLASNPTHIPSCSINAKINCGPALNSWQSQVFGIWNTWLGFTGFSIVIVVSIWLLAGKQLPQRLNITGLTGSFLAFLFTLWLAYQSFYTLGAVCPWCFLVWVATAGILGSFIAMTSHSKSFKNWTAILPFGLPLLIIMLRLLEATLVFGSDIYM